MALRTSYIKMSN